MLISILVIFDLTSCSRAIFDYFRSSNIGYDQQTAILLVFGAYMDLAPICLLLLIHSRNFKTIPFGGRTEPKEKQSASRTSSNLSDATALI